ncbi:hypothetical protein [Streptosporangium sp. NPDC051022]|uniref:hypothetical protein n=1 Tax=Streptosporangium sp. NPDC051022 TaxID=3155752 RepID=UPI00343463C5
MTEEELAAVLAAVVTPQRLWTELDTRRKTFSPQMPWWRVAVELNVSASQLQRLREGAASRAVRRAATKWLEQPAPAAAE